MNEAGGGEKEKSMICLRKNTTATREKWDHAEMTPATLDQTKRTYDSSTIMVRAAWTMTSS